MNKAIASIMALAASFRNKLPQINPPSRQPKLSYHRPGSKTKGYVRALGRKHAVANLARNGHRDGPSRNRLRRTRQRNAADLLRYAFDPEFKAYVDSQLLD
jgi:hypothetical protein